MEDLTKKFLESLAERDKSLAERDKIIEKQQEAMEKLMDRLTHSDDASAEEPSGTSGSGGRRSAIVGSNYAPRSEADIRKDKYLNLFQNLQKCTKFKDYKFSSQENVRE